MNDDELPESITIHAISHPGLNVDPWVGTINANAQTTSLGVVGINTTSQWNGVIGASSIAANGPVNFAEHTIQGQSIYEELRVEKERVQGTWGENQFKERLVEKLVNALFKGKFIEFTKAEDVHTGEIIFRARIFAVPDTKVRILRELGKLAK